MKIVEEEMHLTSNFFIMIADEHNSLYNLFIEPTKESRHNYETHLKVFVSRLEECLSEINVEFDAKRKSERLKATKIHLLKQKSLDALKKFYIEEKGQREAQFKPNILQYEKDLEFPIEESVDENFKKKA